MRRNLSHLDHSQDEREKSHQKSHLEFRIPRPRSENNHIRTQTQITSHTYSQTRNQSVFIRYLTHFSSKRSTIALSFPLTISINFPIYLHKKIRGILFSFHIFSQPPPPPKTQLHPKPPHPEFTFPANAYLLNSKTKPLAIIPPAAASHGSAHLPTSLPPYLPT